MFLNAVVDILGLNKGKSWTDVRRELSDAQVKRIHEVLQAGWPKDSNIVELLPRPDKRVWRAAYVGLVDPRTVEASVTGWLAYFDEIVERLSRIPGARARVDLTLGREVPVTIETPAVEPPKPAQHASTGFSSFSLPSSSSSRTKREL